MLFFVKDAENTFRMNNILKLERLFCAEIAYKSLIEARELFLMTFFVT